MAIERRDQPWLGTAMRYALLLLGCVLAGSPRVAGAVSWIEEAQADLTCTELADDAERASLAAPWLPVPVDARGVTAYFRGKPQDPRHAKFRYLTMLAAVGWWADLVNDQTVRTDAYVTIGTLADRYASGSDAPLFRQVARCARARVISAQLELNRPQAVIPLTDNLLKLYTADAPALPVEDWPLLIALREMRLDTHVRDALAQLATRATVYAGVTGRANARDRSSRLLAAVAQAMLTLGDANQSRQLAMQSMLLTGKPPAPEAAWRVMPTIYDATVKLTGAKDAADLRLLLQPDRPPAAFRDPQSAFESLLRLSLAAGSKQQFDDMSRLQLAASRQLADGRGANQYSMRFYRRALEDLAATRDPDVGTLARRDPAYASRTLATYTGLYDTLLRQAQGQFVADAREQLLFQYKIDNSLHALSDLLQALPRSSDDIADTTFQLAQLRSFGRLTLATLAAQLAHENIDAESRFNVERFFSLSTQTGVWLRALFDMLRVVPDAPPPDGETLWKAFFMLDVFYNETTHEFTKYTAFVRQKAPGVAELATPRPLPVREFQRRLRTGEAIVATLVTPSDLYVWAITSDKVVLSRQRVREEEVRDKVQRLRAGLVPAGGGGNLPPFDAAAAYELYQLVFEPVARALQGVTDVLWFGHGPLGAVPPAVLVTAPPAKAKLGTPADFAASRFLLDRYAFAALADLSLFPWHRDHPLARRRDLRLLGVGAPLLTADEVAGGPRSRTYDLAGGLDGKALADLPKLPESVDEMKGLAGVVGTTNADLWLGPDASERRFSGDALRGYALIALATHGFLPGEVRNVPDPALLLALDPKSTNRYDGILTSREIASLQLDADLVILSACNTASGDGRPRSETFTGLSQAFFTAGARSLMVSHWPVMSGAAVQLSVGTLDRAMKQRLPLARSLQQAMQALRKDGAASAIESHPSYWGPFVIVGDGR
jgi:CHAT domain-containing protein